MPEHAAMETTIVVRSSTAMEVVDGKDRPRDTRVMVARPTMVLGDEVDLVPIVVINVASKVIT